MVLIYGNQSIDDVVFRDDFDLMQKESPKFMVIHVLNDDSRCDIPVKVGFITKDIVMGDLPDYADRKFFICGPPAMVNAMKKILIEGLGLSEDCIIEENFKGY
jgi:NAD(P)H-flavin reductase